LIKVKYIFYWGVFNYQNRKREIWHHKRLLAS